MDKHALRSLIAGVCSICVAWPATTFAMGIFLPNDRSAQLRLSLDIPFGGHGRHSAAPTVGLGIDRQATLPNSVIDDPFVNPATDPSPTLLQMRRSVPLLSWRIDLHGQQSLQAGGATLTSADIDQSYDSVGPWWWIDAVTGGLFASCAAGHFPCTGTLG